MIFKAFKPKLLQQEQGFTLVEVLVAILLVTTFTLVAMQAVVFAAIFKARANQFAEATTWIQEDLDNVKNQASQVPYTATFLTNNAAANQSTIVLTSVNGLRVGDALKVGTDSTNNVIQSIDPSTLTITLSANLGTAETSGAAVIARCDADVSTGGFAGYLNQNLPTLSNGGTKTITGKHYTLTRTRNVRSVAPYEVLELSYSVVPQSGGSAVATVSTEVIPDAAFQCPQS